MASGNDECHSRVYVVEAFRSLKANRPDRAELAPNFGPKLGSSGSIQDHGRIEW